MCGRAPYTLTPYAQHPMRRIEQLAHELRDIVARALPRTVEFPADVLVTVTRATVTENARSATIFLSVLPTEHGSRALLLIERARYALQGMVNKTSTRHHAPRLSFQLEPPGLMLPPTP